MWSNVDPDNATAFNFFCPDFKCEKNGSTIQMHVLELTIDQRYDQDKDGIADFFGYIDRYGLAADDCSDIGVDCIPVIIQGVPRDLSRASTRVQFRDDADMQLGTRGLQDFDLSPAALGTGDEWWIEYPN